MDFQNYSGLIWNITNISFFLSILLFYIFRIYNFKIHSKDPTSKLVATPLNWPPTHTRLPKLGSEGRREIDGMMKNEWGPLYVTIDVFFQLHNYLQAAVFIWVCNFDYFFPKINNHFFAARIESSALKHSQTFIILVPGLSPLPELVSCRVDGWMDKWMNELIN